MKRRLLILLSLGIVLMPSSIAEVGGKYKTCALYDSNDGRVEVSVNSKIGSSVKVRIKNNSKGDIHNVRLMSDKRTRYVLSDTSIFIGELKAGESRTITIKAWNMGSGTIQRAINNVGGVYAFIPLFILCLDGVAFMFLWSKSDRRVKYMQVTVAVLMGMIFVSHNEADCIKNPNVKIEVENAMEIGSEIKWKGILDFSEDTVEVKRINVEDEIPYGADYELDSKVKVTEEPEILEPGEKGKRVRTYEIVFINGEQQSKTLIKDVVEKKPVNQKLKQGTLTVVKKETVEPERVYIPDDTMELGTSELDSEVTGLQDMTGESETTYKWDKKKEEVVSHMEYKKAPGKEYYKAGTLKIKKETLPAETQYIPVETKEVGYENVIKESKDGYINKYFKVKIDKETGEEIKGSDELFVKSERIEPENGKIEVGTLKVKEINEGFETIEQVVEDEWSSYKEVVQEGEERIIKQTTVCKLNKETGICSETDEVHEEVIQEGRDEIVKVGSKEPNWVSFIELQKEISYNTLFVPCEDGSLTGDEQKVVTEGKNGRIYSEYVIACDDEGNELEGYEKKLVSKDAIQEPVDEVIMVASDSVALTIPEQRKKEEFVIGSLTQTDVDNAERKFNIAMILLGFGISARIFPRRRYKSVLKAQETEEISES